MKKLNLNAMRPGNLRAFNLTLQRLTEREPTTAIVKPTRYGKRDLIITTCWQAVEDNIIAGGIVFSPVDQATRQFYRDSKLLQTIARYEMPATEVLGGVRKLSSFGEYQPFSNGEFLLAANIQLCLRTNIQDCVDLVDAEHYRTGKPLVFFIDECQFLAEQKRWGDFFRRVQKAGALLVLYTATPYREDADAIPGFRYNTISHNDERRYFTYDAGDGIHNKIDVWDGVRSLNQLEADDITTFKEAWDEVPAPLCRLDRETVGIPLDGVALKDLNATDTKKSLGKIVRDERFLDPAVRLVLSKLQLTQTIDPRCKAMIVTGSDQANDRRDNAHAETIKRLATNLSPTILGRLCKVRIITLKSQDPEDESLATMMESFLDGDEDIVVVKQAGTVGLDDWRIKTLGYFTPSRSVAAMIQTWMRVATPEGGLKIGHLVMPEDRFCEAIWNKLVVEQGGEAKLSEMSQWTPDELFGSYLKEKEEPPEPGAELPFGPGAISGFDDSRGNVGSLEYYDEVTKIFQRLPKIAEVYTKAEVAVALKQSGHPAPGSVPEPPLWGLQQQLDVLYKDINDSANDLTNKKMMRRAGKYDRNLYEEIRTDIFNVAYRMVGLPKDIKLRQVKNIETLRRMNQFIKDLGNEIQG